jgi:hypothetical protein
MEKIESVPWMSDLLDRAVGAFRTVEHMYPGTMATDLGRKAFVDCLARLNDLQRGTTVRPTFSSRPTRRCTP